ncbi:DNA topoisomerase IV subunit A [Liberiplasma polymorphum]|uniref:DNA topoisomerase IV subunit A n=1 Tax=Liberiplasma polymorphum TaxID=3374570 RepID=UPI00377282F2
MTTKIKEELDTYIEGRILNENLEDIVGDRFGRYSKYIIQDRALPDVRDGLKPVQRRILYAMYKLGMFHDKPYKKSARIVGDVIGKYHPHGDSSVYDALVRLSQYFKMRVPLIDMHGNNGSIDGDSAAAMRYTEARMSEMASHLLLDLDKRTVNFIPNFDDEEYEPIVLPSRFPNLLVNGSSGISAGYATDIPPHNLEEIVKGVIKRIDNPLCTVDDLLKIIKGPDFPTGAIVQGKDGIKEAFETGRGRIIIKSKTHFEDNKIIVTEIPYEINKAVLVRKIDEIRAAKKVDGILEVRDESDKDGLRIAIDVKKDFDLDAILNFLHKKTDLTKSYNYNMVAINNKRPELMGILAIFDSYIYHQKEVVTNRSNYELRKAQKRLHIVEGIIRMMDVIDAVVETIRKSKGKQDAKDRLVKSFKFSEDQAEAILTLQLYRLSNTDLTQLVKEQKSLLLWIDELNDILHNEETLKKVIKKELRQVLKSVDTTRLSAIEEEIERITFQEQELIKSEQVMVGITKDGYVRSASIRSYKATENATLKETDAFMFIDEVSTLDTMLIFTNQGNYLFLPVYKISESKWKDVGTHLNQLFQIDLNEEIIHVTSVKSFEDKMYFLFTTKDNLVKLTELSEYFALRYNKPLRAIGLNTNDEVVHVTEVTDLDAEVLTVSDFGHALRYDVSEIPVTSSSAKGVKAMTLSPKYKLAASTILKDHHDLLVLTTRGTIKRMLIEEIPKKRRALKGIPIIKQVKSNPYFITDLAVLNSTQYKNRARVHIITDRAHIAVNTFDLKINASEAGKKFVTAKQGTPRHMIIEELVIDETIQPLSDYKKEVKVAEEQASLFDAIE